MIQKYHSPEKKKVVILTINPDAARTYQQDLEPIFPENSVEFLTYTPDTFPQEGYIPDISAYLVSANTITYTTGIFQEMPLGIEVVETRVCFRNEELDRIAKIPEGTRCLLVNATEPLALECIVDVHSHSMYNVQMVPYWPGGPDDPEIDTAITAGDLDFIPPHIRSVYDLGHRHISPDTAAELLIALNLEHLLESEGYQNYCRQFSHQRGQSEKLLQRSIQYKSITSHLIESSDHGIIGINGEDRIFCINQMAVDLLDLENEKHTGRAIQDILPFLDFSEYKDDEAGSLPSQQVVQHGDNTLTMSIRCIRENGRYRGLFVRFQRFVDAENKLHDARLKLLQKGHTAKYTFDDIAGSSPAMLETTRMARKMAVTNSAILITGESGTGKELLASAIHNASTRAKQPYIAINCAAMPENLLESELFGYEEGAFTGARKNGKAGLFEHAHQGTLFLDEIEDMSPSLQVKLLRVLQEKEIMRVGGTKIINVDVRIIAATNVNIETMVKNGQIRKDLYYRLNTMQLQLPPLRHRREDIPLLVKRFRIQGNMHFRLSEAVMTRFLNHHWDGNVRELKNCLEYFQCLDKDIIQPEDLPRQFHNPNFSPYSPDSDFLQEEDFAPVPAPQPVSHQNPKPQVFRNPEGFTAEEDFVLRALYGAYRENRLIGRRTICDLAREEDILLTEQEIRKLLKILETRELVKVGSGRAGSRLTPKGIALMQKGIL